MESSINDKKGATRKKVTLEELQQLESYNESENEGQEIIDSIYQLSLLVVEAFRNNNNQKIN